MISGRTYTNPQGERRTITALSDANTIWWKTPDVDGERHCTLVEWNRWVNGNDE